MALQDTVLQPGEFAIYLDTNGSIELGRLTAFLDCFRWINDQGVVPAYDLEIIDLRKKCIFARLGLVWRDKVGPDPGVVSKMEHEIERLREKVDATAVRAADAAVRAANANEAQVAETRKATRAVYAGIAVTAALGITGLILENAADAKSDSPNACATAIADLMEHDGLVSLKLWSPDCSVTIHKQDVPEYLRRERVVRRGTLSATEEGGDTFTGSGTVEPSPYGAGAYGAGDYSEELARGEVLRAGRHVRFDQIDAPTRATLFDATPEQVRRFIGRIEQYEDFLVLLPPPKAHDVNNPDPPMILIPNEPLTLKMGHSYEVHGRLFKSPSGIDVVAAQSVTDRGVLGK